MKKWTRNLNFIIAIAFIGFLSWNTISIPVFASGETTPEQSNAVSSTSIYYVSAAHGLDTNRGTLDTPLKTLQKALELAKDHAVIYILDDIVVQHTDGSDNPLVIQDAVTIAGAFETGTLPMLSLRTGGVILGADVTFQNVQLGASGFLRPGIAANGHTLKLVNVQQNTTNLRPLQIYGGTFFDYSADGIGKGTDYGSAVRGSVTNILIEGGSYDAIYAGSTNGSIDIPVNISVKKENGLELVKGIYAGSTMKDPQDTTTSGEIPAIDKSIELSGTVNVETQDLNHSGTVVDGVSENHTVNLSVSGTGMYSFVVNCLDSLTVNYGTFVPAKGSNFGITENHIPNVELVGSRDHKATLDLSEYADGGCEIAVNDFTGTENSILILASDGTLNINGTLLGTDIEFRASGNGVSAGYWRSAEEQGYSGWIEYGRKYINSSKGDGTFVITNPYITQENIAFTADSNAQNGWTIILVEVSLEDFSLTSKKVLHSDFNDWGCEIDMEAAFCAGSEQNLSFIPFDYKVTYTDLDGTVTEYERQSSAADEEGYCFCEYKSSANSADILLNFEPVSYEDVDEEDNVYMKHLLYVNKGTNDLPFGTYEIDMSAETASGTMIKSFALQIVNKAEATFGTEEVYRIAGKDRYDTSLRVADTLKKQMGTAKFDTIILADGRNFPDALAGSYLAGKHDAPILMTNPEEKYVRSLKAYIEENLVKGGKIYILGGESAVPSVVLNGFSEKYDIERLGGENRYVTNLRILEEAGVANDEILVCTGKDFADSLSASATGKPILLVNDTLNDQQKAFLEAHRENKRFIIGGESAVSKALEEELNVYGKVDRIAGKDRYVTSIEVANTFFREPKAAVLAYANNFPDGLCGGPLAMSKHAPLILTENRMVDIASDYMKSENIGVGAVLGGTILISDVAVKNIFGVLDVTKWE